MPWHVVKDTNACSVSKPWAVKKKGDESLVACHKSKQDAQKQVAALYAQEQKSLMTVAIPDATAPNGQAAGRHRTGVRLALIDGALEYRDKGDSAESPVMRGHFAVFNEWTQINSFFEGRFLESIAPGAFTKTFSERRDKIKVLFQHGRDSSTGARPLGVISQLREDKRGAYYEVDLFDVGYVNDLVPALRTGQLGASFKFEVMREEITDEPARSTHNPDGIQERVIKEVRLYEFGPVTFPAYESATAGLRSITDDYAVQAFTDFASLNPDGMRDFLMDHLGMRAKLEELIAAERETITVTATRTTEASADEDDEARDEPAAEDTDEETAENRNHMIAKANHPECPDGMPHAVMDGQKVIACHSTLAAARKHADGGGGTPVKSDDNEEQEAREAAGITTTSAETDTTEGRDGGRVTSHLAPTGTTPDHVSTSDSSAANRSHILMSEEEAEPWLLEPKQHLRRRA